MTDADVRRDLRNWLSLYLDEVAEAEPTRKIFVGYPFSVSKEDYRGALNEVAAEFDVEFVYADDEITSKHILEKIEAMIRRTDFSLFDISTWNPNVTLELGIARGADADYYILFNPNEKGDVPADVGGIDRIQYADFASLKEGLRKLLTQQIGPPASHEQATEKQLRAQLEKLEEKLPEIVTAKPGLLIGELASELGVEVELAQLIVKPLIKKERLVTRGTRRGTRYYVPENAPEEGAESLSQVLKSLKPGTPEWEEFLRTRGWRGQRGVG